MSSLDKQFTSLCGRDLDYYLFIYMFIYLFIYYYIY